MSRVHQSEPIVHSIVMLFCWTWEPWARGKIWASFQEVQGRATSELGQLGPRSLSAYINWYLRFSGQVHMQHWTIDFTPGGFSKSGEIAQSLLNGFPQVSFVRTEAYISISFKPVTPGSEFSPANDCPPRFHLELERAPYWWVVVTWRKHGGRQVSAWKWGINR